MLENIIILVNDITVTIATYWDKHPIFTAIVGSLIALRILWALIKAAKRLLTVIFNR